jgi:hypothetical protein
MGGSTTAYYTINIGLHVLILFCFLAVFFFLFISKKAEQAVSDEISSSVGKSVDSALNSLRNAENQYPVFKVNWVAINQKALNMEASSQGNIQSIKDNNQRLKTASIIAAGGMATLLGVAIIYFHFYSGMNLQYGQIVVTNIIAFSLVGLVEYLFFVKIASKYSVVNPSLMNDAVISRVEDKAFDYINSLPDKPT